jgi:hypothetical protein
MRVMALALTSMLAVFVADSQAFAAKRGSSVGLTRWMPEDACEEVGIPACALAA